MAGRPLLLGSLALLLVSCSRERPLIVASKGFTEQLVLGEILAQHVENRLGVRVQRKLNLGGTLLVHQALVKGYVDLYPEYTGTALTSVLKLPPQAEAGAVLRKVQEEYQRRFQLEWLEPLGFNDTFAMVIRGQEARASRIASLSEASALRAWALGVGYEFQSRPDGLSALQHVYPLKLTAAPRNMDLGLLYRALSQGQVDMIAGNSTDGQLAALDVTVLRDDRRAFPPYQACVVARPDALARVPGLRAALAELYGSLDEARMRRLNYEVDTRHRPVREVAAAFLQTLPAKR